MKKSEQLETLACQQEEDWKAWELHAQAARERKFEEFQEDDLPRIELSEFVYKVTPHENMFKIHFADDIIADYYPKSDRLCLPHQRNKWMNRGRAWIFEKLIKMDNQ